MKLHAAALLPALATIALAGAASAQAPSSQAPGSQAPAANAPAKPAISHVRAKDGAKLRNLPDPNGVVVLTAESGALMSVSAERAGWLEVEPACGMKVWVHGSFLKPAAEAGYAEVTAGSVRMRPRPSSDESSFPLPVKLDRGARVRVIARADVKKNLEEDWVQVWSPPGARAWIAAAETAPLAAGEDVRTAWAADLKKSQAARPLVDLSGLDASRAAAGGTRAAAKDDVAGGAVAAREAAAKKPEPKTSPAVEQLGDAEKKMAAARASENPDFAPAKAAYQAVVAAAPNGASADTAKARLDEIAVREDLQKLKVDKEKYEQERAGKLSEAEAKLRDVSKRQDPLWGRFQARGWLERELVPGELPRYVVRWGGKDVAEIACGSGRYDLERYVGSEVGVVGVTQRAAVAGTADLPGTPARIDVTRIEVISARR